MTLREAYNFKPLNMKGLENKEKFYEAYEEIEPILTQQMIKQHRNVSVDNPYFLQSTFLKKKFFEQIENLDL